MSSKQIPLKSEFWYSEKKKDSMANMFQIKKNVSVLIHCASEAGAADL